MPPAPTGEDLAGLLEEHRIGILSAWIDALFGLPNGHYRDYAPDTVRAWASTALRAAAGAMRGEIHEPRQDPAVAVSRILSEHGFTIEQVVEGLLLLSQVVEPFLRRAYGQPAETLAAARRAWDAGQRRLLGTVAEAFAAEMLQDIERAHARTALMLAAAETAGRSLDVRTVYERVAADILAALPVAFCAVYEADEAEETFYVQRSVGRLGDERLHQILNRPLRPAIDPLVRRALADPEQGPQRSRHKEPFLGQTTCRALRIEAAYLIPIVTPDRTQALVLCIDLDSRHASGDALDDQLELAWGIAQTVAPAVGNARLHADTERQLRVSQSLQKMNEAILGRQSSQRVFELICAETRELASCSGTAVYEAKTEMPLREIARAGFVPDALPGALAALVPSLHEPAAAGNTDDRPILLADLRQHPALGPRNPIHSLMVLRLRAGRDVVGALLLVDRERNFTPADVRHVRLFADQGAIALDHARMLARQERLALVEERQRLARDLHDSVSQSLYGLTMYAEAASRSVESGAHEKAISYLHSLRDTSLDALKEMRLLIFDLRPTLLAEEGLVHALRSRLASVERRCGMHTDLRAAQLARLPRQIEESLYGIACEALGNVLKHARASRVEVRLHRDRAGLELAVIDNGVGFDPESGWRSGGYGLRSLRERTEAIGATLTIDSGPGAGTCVRVQVGAELLPLAAE